MKTDYFFSSFRVRNQEDFAFSVQILDAAETAQQLLT